MLSQRVSEYVRLRDCFRFGDSYRISKVCKLDINSTACVVGDVTTLFWGPLRLSPYGIGLGLGKLSQIAEIPPWEKRNLRYCTMGEAIALVLESKKPSFCSTFFKIQLWLSKKWYCWQKSIEGVTPREIFKNLKIMFWLGSLSLWKWNLWEGKYFS